MPARFWPMRGSNTPPVPSTAGTAPADGSALSAPASSPKHITAAMPPANAATDFFNPCVAMWHLPKSGS